MSEVIIKQLVDNEGNSIAGLTPEEAVYDQNGVRLKNKIVKLQSEKEDKTSKQIISDIEYDALVASGEILPDVLYYTYEA